MLKKILAGTSVFEPWMHKRILQKLETKNMIELETIEIMINAKLQEKGESTIKDKIRFMKIEQNLN